MVQIFIVLCILSPVFVYISPKPTSMEENVEPLENFENLTFTFNCSDKAVGFYADQEYNCQIFHMCNEEGKRIPHVCANETSFNQEFRICDWEYNFDCSEAHKWYYLNELTYATEPSKEEEV